MTNQNIENEVKQIIADKKGIKEEEINLDSNMQNDLNLDSLDAVEVIMAVEDKFDIEIPDEKAEELTTVRQIIEYITEKKNKS